LNRFRALGLAFVTVLLLAAACRPGGGATSSASNATDTGEDAVAQAATGTSKAPISVPNALGLPNASVAAVVNPMNLPSYAGPTGSVEGTVLVRGPDAPDVPSLDVHACPAALDTYGKLFRAGPRQKDGLRPLADALVIITGYSGYFLPERSDAKRVTISASCGYPTRTISLTFGQRIDIANDSTLPFAPFLEGAAQMPMMIAPPQQRGGEPAKIFPPRADYFPLRDQLQKYVHEDVFVLRQPLHAVTDIQGHFRIDGVPAEKLHIGARLGSLLGEAVTDVDVHPNAVESVDLVLTYTPSDAGTILRPPGAFRRAQ
jgi:hypothetical protein